MGFDARTFSGAGQLASWVGTIPGSDIGAERNLSSRSPKGNRSLRRIFTQAEQAAVKTKGCHFQNLFRRLITKLGYNGAIWAIANRLCRLVWKIPHDGVRYAEQASEATPQAKKRRAQGLTQALRKLGYQVALTPIASGVEGAQGRFSAERTNAVSGSSLADARFGSRATFRPPKSACRWCGGPPDPGAPARPGPICKRVPRAV